MSRCPITLFRLVVLSHCPVTLPRHYLSHVSCAACVTLSCHNEREWYGMKQLDDDYNSDGVPGDCRVSDATWTVIYRDF
eukprot:1331761-Amorphochlora_amoeboformis.AAC.1